jgi:hypothetical protein
MGVIYTQRLTISGKDAEQIVKTTGNELCFDKLFDCEGDLDAFCEQFGFISPNLDDNEDNWVVNPWRQLEDDEDGEAGELEEYWEERNDGTFEEDPDDPWEEGEEPEWDVKSNFKTASVFSCTVATEHGDLSKLIVELHKKFELFESEVIYEAMSCGTVGQFNYWIWMDDDEPDYTERVDFIDDDGIVPKDQLTKYQWQFVEETLCSLHTTYRHMIDRELSPAGLYRRTPIQMTPEDLRDQLYDSFEWEYTPVSEMFPDS